MRSGDGGCSKWQYHCLQALYWLNWYGAYKGVDHGPPQCTRGSLSCTTRLDDVHYFRIFVCLVVCVKTAIENRRHATYSSVNRDSLKLGPQRWHERVRSQHWTSKKLLLDTTFNCMEHYSCTNEEALGHFMMNVSVNHSIVILPLVLPRQSMY